MEREQVVNILNFYKTIEKNMKFNKKILEDIEECYNPLESKRYDDIHTRSAPTELVAINISDDVKTRSENIMKQNKKLAMIKVEILKEISALNYVHKVIIFDFYINNNKWVQISGQLNYSIRHCKNLRDDAIDVLKDKFEGNKVIKEILSMF